MEEKPKKLTPLKAIKAKCIDCCGGSAHEARRCHIEGCPLWPYRKGHLPKRAVANEEAM